MPTSWQSKIVHSYVQGPDIASLNGLNSGFISLKNDHASSADNFLQITKYFKFDVEKNWSYHDFCHLLV